MYFSHLFLYYVIRTLLNQATSYFTYTVMMYEVSLFCSIIAVYLLLSRALYAHLKIQLNRRAELVTNLRARTVLIDVFVGFY